MKKIFYIAMLCIVLAGCSLTSGWDNPMPEDDFLVIAHRGASAYEPENTLPAFKLAENLDADYIELDVHLTKDGELVVMHDDDVKRTTESAGMIKEQTLAELKALTADEKKGEKVAVSGAHEEAEYEIPTLSEVIKRLKGEIKFVIELKDTEQYPGIEEKLVDLMHEKDIIGEDRKGYPTAVIHSFDEPALKKVHELDPDIPLLQLISFDEGEEAHIPKEDLKEINAYAVGVGVSHEALTEDFVKAMHKKELAVYGYTVNDAEEAKRLKEIGANGIHTNEPDLLDD